MLVGEYAVRARLDITIGTWVILFLSDVKHSIYQRLVKSMGMEEKMLGNLWRGGGEVGSFHLLGIGEEHLAPDL